MTCKHNDEAAETVAIITVILLAIAVGAMLYHAFTGAA